MKQVILNFHGIGQPGRTLEPGEDVYWITQEFFESVLGLAHALKGSVHTGFTFDDGNYSDLAIGAEGLARYGLKGHFFVLASRIGEVGSLNVADIRTLQAAGHEIGSHGADHVDWRAADTTVLSRELDDARQIIEEAVQGPVRAAAIPFGRYNARVLRALRAFRYDRVYSSDGGFWGEGQFPIPRTSIKSSMRLGDIETILLGRESPQRRLRRALSMTAKRWV